MCFYRIKDRCLHFIHHKSKVDNKIPGLGLELQAPKILSASPERILFSQMKMLSNVNPKTCLDDKKSAKGTLT